MTWRQWPRRRRAPEWSYYADPTTRPAPWSLSPMCSDSCGGGRMTPSCCSTRLTSGCAPLTPRSPDLVRQFPNVIVLRTFSKAYGLAGLRIGYGFGSPELARILWKMQLPFGMGITSLVAVAGSYDAEDQLRQRILRNTGERDYLRRRLRAMGVYSTETHANFVYLPPRGRPWRAVFDRAGMEARHYADGGVRITVGARASTQAVLAAVGKSMAISSR